MSATAYVLPRELRASDGSAEITVWCPCCVERTVPGRNGCCMWCDTPLTEEAVELAAAHRQERTPTVAKLGNSETSVAPLMIAGTPLPSAPAPTRRRAGRPVGRTTSLMSPSEESGEIIRLPRRRPRGGNRHRRAYTDEQIVARIQLWERLTGSPPAKADWNPAKLKRRAATARGHIERHMKLLALYEMGDFPSETTVRGRYGSMNAALVAAGFEPRAAGRQPTTGKGIGKPKIGRDALCDYWQIVQGNLDGDEVELKASLYNLALSAFWLADRLGGAEVA